MEKTWRRDVFSAENVPNLAIREIKITLAHRTYMQKCAPHLWVLKFKESSC